MSSIYICNVVVLMGMGEPLANYKNVMEAVRRINTELGIGARHITLSTSGMHYITTLLSLIYTVYSTLTTYTIHY